MTPTGIKVDVVILSTSVLIDDKVADELPVSAVIVSIVNRYIPDPCYN